MVPSGIVDNDNHEFAFTPMTEKLLQEQEKRGSIKSLIQEINKASAGVADSPENTNTFARRCMKHHRVGILWWYPHGAA